MDLVLRSICINGLIDGRPIRLMSCSHGMLGRNTRLALDYFACANGDIVRLYEVQLFVDSKGISQLFSHDLVGVTMASSTIPSMMNQSTMNQRRCGIRCDVSG